MLRKKQVETVANEAGADAKEGKYGRAIEAALKLYPQQGEWKAPVAGAGRHPDDQSVRKK